MSTALTLWINEFAGVAKLAAELARTPFVPDSLRVYRDGGGRIVKREDGTYDPETTAAWVTAAIMSGQEVGLEPMAAIQNIYISNGRPGLTALAHRGIVQRAGHEMWVDEATSQRAIVKGHAKGSTHVQFVKWDMDRARAKKLDQKPNWRADPEGMLKARATAELARLIGADVLLGLPYTVDELRDGDGDVDVPTAVVEPPTGKQRRTRRTTPVKQAAAELGIPVLEVALPEADEPPMMSTAQRKAMFAAFGHIGVTDDADRLAMTSALVGRDVRTSNDLSMDEYAHLMDELHAIAAEEGSGDEEPPPPEDSTDD